MRYSRGVADVELDVRSASGSTDQASEGTGYPSAVRPGGTTGGRRAIASGDCDTSDCDVRRATRARRTSLMSELCYLRPMASCGDRFVGAMSLDARSRDVEATRPRWGERSRSCHRPWRTLAACSSGSRGLLAGVVGAHRLCGLGWARVGRRDSDADPPQGGLRRDVSRGRLCRRRGLHACLDHSIVGNLLPSRWRWCWPRSSLQRCSLRRLGRHRRLRSLRLPVRDDRAAGAARVPALVTAAGGCAGGGEFHRTAGARVSNPPTRPRVDNEMIRSGRAPEFRQCRDQDPEEGTPSVDAAAIDRGPRRSQHRRAIIRSRPGRAAAGGPPRAELHVGDARAPRHPRRRFVRNGAQPFGRADSRQTDRERSGTAARAAVCQHAHGHR